MTEMDSSGYLLVREVYPDSPAQMAGIKVGALITNVNGTRVTENNNESMAGRLRGEAGTKVTLTIQQDSQENIYELTLRAGNRQALRQRFTQADGGSGYTRIAELNVPTLIIWGGRDQLIPPVNAERFQRDIEGSRVVLFDDLGHVPQEEDPARTVAALQTFLNE